MIYLPLTIFKKIISLGGWTTTDPIEPISEEKSLLKNNCKDMFLFPYVILMALVVSPGRRGAATTRTKTTTSSLAWLLISLQLMGFQYAGNQKLNSVFQQICSADNKFDFAIIN